MTVENGAVEATNDTIVADQNTDQTVADQNTDETGDTEGDEGDDDQQQSAPDEVEVDYEGEKFKLPTKLKDALLRQADYTRKTQEVAERARALEAEKENFGKQTEAQKLHLKAAARLQSLDDQLEPYAKMTPNDWVNLRNTDPNAYQDHWVNYDFLKNQRESAARDFSQKEMEQRQTAERENANRMSKAIAEIARHLPEWTPGGELDTKLQKYATEELKIPAKDLGETAMRIPQLVKELNRLRLYDEAAKKQQTQQSVQQSLKVQPVTRVGGNGGSAARRTTDSSGDALDTAVWIKREEERVRKRR